MGLTPLGIKASSRPAGGYATTVPTKSGGNHAPVSTFATARPSGLPTLKPASPRRTAPAQRKASFLGNTPRKLVQRDPIVPGVTIV